MPNLTLNNDGKGRGGGYPPAPASSHPTCQVWFGQLLCQPQWGKGKGTAEEGAGHPAKTLG